MKIGVSKMIAVYEFKLSQLHMEYRDLKNAFKVLVVDGAKCYIISTMDGRTITKTNLTIHDGFTNTKPFQYGCVLDVSSRQTKNSIRTKATFAIPRAWMISFENGTLKYLDSLCSRFGKLEKIDWVRFNEDIDLHGIIRATFVESTSSNKDGDDAWDMI